MILMGVAEVADLLQVSRQRVHQLAALPGSPRPLANISAGLIWDRRDIERWAVDEGRLYREED